MNLLIMTHHWWLLRGYTLIVLYIIIQGGILIPVLLFFFLSFNSFIPVVALCSLGSCQAEFLIVKLYASLI